MSGLALGRKSRERDKTQKLRLHVCPVRGGGDAPSISIINITLKPSLKVELG